MSELHMDTEAGIAVLKHLQQLAVVVGMSIDDLQMACLKLS